MESFFFTKKWLTNLIEREHCQNDTISKAIGKPKNDIVDQNRNNRTLMVGPSFSGNSYLALKVPSQIPDRDIYIFTNSLPEQHSTSVTKIKEMSDEKKPLSQYENANLVLDDILVLSNSRHINQFFIRGRHINLDIYYLSQSNFLDREEL